MSSEFLVAGSAAIVFFALIWAAVKAKPLGQFSYRWATWQAIESVLLAVLSICFVIALASKTALGAMLFGLVGLLSLFSGVGLWRRKRSGAVCLVASQMCFFVIGVVMDTYQKPSGSISSAGNNAGVLCLLVTDVLYFKKRWRLLAPGFKVFMDVRGNERRVREHANRTKWYSGVWFRDKPPSGTTNSIYR